MKKQPCVALAFALIVLPLLSGPAEAETKRWKVKLFGGAYSAGADATNGVTSYTFEDTINNPLDGTIDVTRSVNGFQMEPAGGYGAGVSAEFRPIDLLGIELGGSFGQIDTDLSLLVDATVLIITPPVGDPVAVSVPSRTVAGKFSQDLNQFYLGANFYPVRPGRPVALLVGPFVSQVMYGDDSVRLEDPAGTIESGVAIEADDDTAIGVHIGIDIRVGKKSPWLITTGMRYLSSSSEIRFTAEPPVVMPAEPVEVKYNPYFFYVGAGYKF